MSRTAIPFAKMHGLGNDFIVVRKRCLADGEDWTARFVSWCDRRTGIGADGVLVLSEEDRTSFRLEVVNQDGSVPETCGNGIRCAIRSWAVRQRLSEGKVAVRTAAGLKTGVLHPDGQVTVDMGPATFLDPGVGEGPPGHPIPSVVVSTTLGDCHGLAISMGNPHLVLFDAPPELMQETQAARLEHHPFFPRGANVSFARVVDPTHIALAVWERGCGFTQACGSAACATAAAAVARGRIPAGTPIAVMLPGGELTIEVSADLSQVLMTGPAQWVFSGRIPGRFTVPLISGPSPR